MTFKELAEKRYSVRKFDPRHIEPEVLGQILEIGNLAPTAKNVQPHHIYVVQSKEKLELLNTLSPCLYGAPAVLVFTINKDEEWHNPYEPDFVAGEEDASIVATHIMLAATELNVGTCWVNMFKPTETVKALGLPENEKAVLLLPMGYPAEDAAPSERHAQNKPLDEIVRYL